jgi:hypothetical protein
MGFKLILFGHSYFGCLPDFQANAPASRISTSEGPMSWKLFC